MAVGIRNQREPSARGPAVAELLVASGVGDAGEALGGVVDVVVGNDQIVAAVPGFGFGDEAERVAGVDGGLRAGDGSLLELALGFAGGAFAAVGVGGALPGGDLDGGLAGCQLVVQIPGPLPDLAVLVGFGELAAEALWKLLKSGWNNCQIRSEHSL
ncbi:MAG: hypothetical protein K0M66_10980 [Thiobacillus sp.]|nr:hypothetical protein [Thiobacillus sp.]